MTGPRPERTTTDLAKGRTMADVVIIQHPTIITTVITMVTTATDEFVITTITAATAIMATIIMATIITATIITVTIIMATIGTVTIMDIRGQVINEHFVIVLILNSCR